MWPAQYLPSLYVESYSLGVIHCILMTIRTALANSVKSVESDHGCTSRIYFYNADDNVTLTLFNVTLTSQKPC